MSDDQDPKDRDIPTLTVPTTLGVEKPAPPAQNRLQLQLDATVAQGVYSNLTLLSHTENEFVVDFAFVPPTQVGARVRSRVILSPRQAKRLAASLDKAVSQYEQRFGPIALAEAATDEPPLH